MGIFKLGEARERYWVTGQFRMVVIENGVLGDVVIPKPSVAQRDVPYYVTVGRLENTFGNEASTQTMKECKHACV